MIRFLIRLAKLKFCTNIFAKISNPKAPIVSLNAAIDMELASTALISREVAEVANRKAAHKVAKIALVLVCINCEPKSQRLGCHKEL